MASFEDLHKASPSMGLLDSAVNGKPYSTKSGDSTIDMLNPLNAFDNPIINKVLGINGGGGGGAYDVSQGMPGYQQGSNVAGLQQAQGSTQNSIAQQQAFLNALTMGHGLNANQQGVFGQQQGLANQYQMMAAGQGPNPAQAQLAQNTGQNIQQQAALMGSMRGGQANPGLMARQASQQGGAIQQQSAGQAATLGAQQQIAAQQGLAQQQAQMAALATAGVGQQQVGLNQLGQQNLGYQQSLQGGLTAQNEQLTQARSANVPLYAQQMKQDAGLLGGLLNSGGGMLAMLAQGGRVPAQAPSQQLSPLGMFSNGVDATPTQFASNGGRINGQAKVSGDSKKNDTVPAMLSPGEIVIPRSHVDSPEKIASFLNGLLGTSFQNVQRKKG